MEYTSALSAGPQWSDNDIFTKLWRYVHFSPEEKAQTRQKVQAVSDYLFSDNLFLKGARPDGNCFFHSFLSCYAEKTKKNALLEQKNNKIKYLRKIVAEQIRERNQARAAIIEKNRTWITSDEGVKIAPLLEFPIRMITVHLAKDNVVIEDVVHKVDGTFQHWQTNSLQPSLQETPIIVDLGGHFIWASDTDPLNNLPQLSISKLTVKYQEVTLDGTEENFREALKKIAMLYGKKFKAKSSPDDSYESDEDFTKEQSEYKPYVWRGNSPPLAFRTTITCIDGNVKGNEILTQCRSYISNFLNQIRLEDGEGAAMDDDDAAICPGMYFAMRAGRFAKCKTSLDCQQKFSPGTYFFGVSQVKLLLDENERLVIVDDDLKNWITQILGENIKKWDLPYRGYYDNEYHFVIGIREIIGAIKNKVISYTAPEPRNVPDNELGTAQLYCAFPFSYPIGEAYCRLLQQGALHKFLDFLNALIFGVEASRNNLVFLTGLLALLDMRTGSYPTEEGQKGHYLYDDLFDLFPMAVTGASPGNFVAEKAMYMATEQLEKNKSLLAGRRPLGFSSFRENPIWLKVALKSEILIYNWLANLGVIGFANKEPRNLSVESLEILKTDDWEMVNRKREHNEQVSEPLENQIHKRLYEEILHHYLNNEELLYHHLSNEEDDEENELTYDSEGVFRQSQMAVEENSDII